MNIHHSPAKSFFSIFNGFLAFFSSMIWIWGAFSYCFSGLPVTLVQQPLSESPGPPIHTGTIIEQSFYLPADGITEIALLFGTYCRRNQGVIHGHLRNHSYPESVERSFSIELERLTDNEWTTIPVLPPFPPHPLEKGVLTLEGEGISPENAVTLWRTEFDAFVDGNAIINHVPQSGDLAFILRGHLQGISVFQRIRAQWSLHKPAVWVNLLWLILAMLLWTSGLFGVLLSLSKNRN